MATKKISELPAATADLAATDLFEVSKGGTVSQKLTGTQLANGVKTTLGLATVAVTGAYNDLTGKPTVLPDAPSDGKAYGRYNATWAQVALYSWIGAVNGIAQLDGSGKVPAAQLPSYVDDILEFPNLAAFPLTGETGKIYIALDTNQQYRWSGSTYVALSSAAGGAVWGSITGTLSAQADLQTALNEKEPTIPAGTTAQYLRGDKSLSDFSTDTRAVPLTGLSTATSSPIVAADSLLQAAGKLQAQVSSEQMKLRALASTSTVPGFIAEHRITDPLYPWSAQQNIDFRLQRLDSLTLRIGASGPICYSQNIFDVTIPDIVTFAQQDIALSTLPGLTTDGIYVLHVSVKKDGSLTFTATSQSTSIDLVQLGIIVVKRVAGVISFLDGTNGVDVPVVTLPTVAMIDNYVRDVAPLKATTRYVPVGANLQIKNAAGSIIGEGANWGDDTDPHKRAISAANPSSMRYITSGLTASTSLAAKVTNMDPANYWNGTAIVAVGGPSSAATVQRLLVTVSGELFVQYGEFVYNDLGTAVASIDTAPFAANLAGTYAVEVARVAIRKVATDLTNTNFVQFSYTGGGGASGGGLSDAPSDGNTYGRKDGAWSAIVMGGAPAWGSITGTLSDQLDLKAALDGKQTLNGNLTAISGLTTATDKLTYWTGVGTAALADLTGFARSLLDDGSAATARTTLGLATVASTGAYADLTGQPTVLPDAPSDGSTYGRKDGGWSVISAGSAATWGSITGTLSAQTDLQAALDGKQPMDATLTALAGLATGANKIPYATGTDTFGLLDFDTDVNLAANSDTSVPSQKAIKAYVDSHSSGGGQATFTPLTFTPAAGTTSLPIAGGYLPGCVLVAKGAAMLQPAEFTASNGTSISLTTASTAGDTYVVYVFAGFSVTNALMKTGDTATGPMVFGSTLTVNGVGTYTKAQRSTYVALTDAATVALDLSLSNFYRVTLAGNRTLAEPTNAAEGQSGQIDVYQDATGSRTLAFAWCYNYISGNPPTLTTTKLALDQLCYTVNVAKSNTVTIAIANPGSVTWTNHGLAGGQKVQLTTTGLLPTGLSPNTTYWVIVFDANTIRFASTLANAQSGVAINTSGTQSGVHTLKAITVTVSMMGDVR